MDINEKGIEIIKHYEGCRLTAYRDPVGILTIGWGTTGSFIYDGMTITQEEADEYLMKDVEVAVSELNNNLTVSLNDDQFSALVSFLYNIGPGVTGVKDGLFHLASGGPSTLWKMVEESNFSGAAGQFTLWCRAGGIVLRGLLARRRSEQKLFAYGTLDF